MDRRRPPTAEQREQVFDRDGNKCVLCGTTDNLQVATLLPRWSHAENTLENYLTLCSRCHARIHSESVLGSEFDSFIQTLLNSSPHFTSVQRETKLPNSPFLFDIVAKEDGVTVAIECKSAFGFVRSRLTKILVQLAGYRSQTPNHKFVLATLGELTEEQQKLVADHGIEYWGPRHLSERYAEQLRKMQGNLLPN